VAHLFVRTPEHKWAAQALAADGLDLRLLLAPDRADTPAGATRPGRTARIVAHRNGDALRWLILAGPDAHLHVNGVPLGAIGMRALSDRDEISLPGVGSVFYSAEVLAEVVAFPGADHVVLCGRCRQEIKAGSPVVKCPGCGTWYDETKELNCFSYQTHCAFCPQTTALDAGFNWIPAE